MLITLHLMVEIPNHQLLHVAWLSLLHLHVFRVVFPPGEQLDRLLVFCRNVHFEGVLEFGVCQDALAVVVLGGEDFEDVLDAYHIWVLQVWRLALLPQTRTFVRFLGVNINRFGFLDFITFAIILEEPFPG